MHKTALAFFLLPALSWADEAKEPKVDVQADVVLAKVSGNSLDPAALAAMQQALMKKVKYGTLKRLSTNTYALTKKAVLLPLPNQKAAELSLESLAARPDSKEQVATVRVKVPPSDTTYTLGREGSLYLQAGTHDGGELWLVLSRPK